MDFFAPKPRIRPPRTQITLVPVCVLQSIILCHFTTSSKRSDRRRLLLTLVAPKLKSDPPFPPSLEGQYYLTRIQFPLFSLFNTFHSFCIHNNLLSVANSHGTIRRVNWPEMCARKHGTSWGCYVQLNGPKDAKREPAPRKRKNCYIAAESLREVHTSSPWLTFKGALDFHCLWTSS